MKMKWMTQALLAGSLGMVSITAHAFLNPEPAWYGGLIVGANYAANVPFTYVNTSGVVEPGQLGHNIMGSIGGQIGYRWCDNYRAEAEFFFNNSPYSYLRLGDVTIHSPKTSSDLRLKGKTDSGIATFNIFYDIFGDFSSQVVPYLGVGGGYAYLKSEINFYFNDELVTPEDYEDTVGAIPSKRSKSGPVGQAIVGVSYYMDDFSYFALDVRYLISADQIILNQQARRTTNEVNARYQLYSFNIVFNGAFDAVN